MIKPKKKQKAIAEDTDKQQDDLKTSQTTHFTISTKDSEVGGKLKKANKNFTFKRMGTIGLNQNHKNEKQYESHPTATDGIELLPHWYFDYCGYSIELPQRY